MGVSVGTAGTRINLVISTRRLYSGEPGTPSFPTLLISVETTLRLNKALRPPLPSLDPGDLETLRLRPYLFRRNHLRPDLGRH